MSPVDPNSDARRVPAGSPLGRRTLLLGGGSAAAAALLAACSEEQAPPAVPSGPSATASPPVVDSGQLADVVTDIVGLLDKADADRNAQELAPRIIGSAAEFRTRAYEIIAAVPEFAETLDKPSATVLVVLPSTTDAFPRDAIALVTDQNSQGIHYFMGLQQADARSPYTTWGWARQAADIELPLIEADTTGAAAVAVDADDLLMTPKDAFALYADVLSRGDDADPEDRIAPDPYQTEIHTSIQGERTSLNQNVPVDSLATIHEAYTVQDGEYLGLRTADGGAVVLGSLRSSRVLRTVNGATVTIGDTTADGKPLTEVRLAGKTTFTTEFIRDYGEIVALYIPLAEAGGRIQPIGVTRSLLGARGT